MLTCTDDSSFSADLAEVSRTHARALYEITLVPRAAQEGEKGGEVGVAVRDATPPGLCS